MSFETEAFQDYDGNELQLEKMGPPFSSLTPVSSRSKNNQQLSVFFPLVELFNIFVVEFQVWQKTTPWEYLSIGSDI